MRSLIGRRRRPVRDPAPSRLAWRIERWMLTPGIVFLLRAGVPFALALGLGTWWFTDPVRQASLTEFFAETRASIEARPEFQVRLMIVEGASTKVIGQVHEALPLTLPMSSFDLDLEDLRARVETLDAVRSAVVRLRPGGLLQVDVEERVPVVVWRAYDRVTLIDKDGTHVRTVATRLVRPDLPLIAGVGANAHVAEALDLMAAADPLGDRLRGLVRVSERRWDVVLDRGQRILLPEVSPRPALERVLALDAAEDLLARDVARIDMRLGARPTLQMNADATAAWWRIQSGQQPD